MCKNLLRLLIISLLIFHCMPGTTQAPPDNPYVSNRDNSGFLPDYLVKRAGLLSDIDMYIDYIDKVHPDPYRLISEKDFISEIEQIKAEIRAIDHDNIDIFDCYYYLQKIAVLIQDGHTKIYKPTNWDKLMSSFFPLNIKIIEGRMFVSENFGKNEIPSKAEILSINDKSVEEIISEMLFYCEGTFHEFKLIRLEEEFRYFIHTLYKSGPPWKIEYGFTDKKIITSIGGISSKILTKKNKKNYGSANLLSKSTMKKFLYSIYRILALENKILNLLSINFLTIISISET